MSFISPRALANLEPNGLGEVRKYCYHKQFDRDFNPSGTIIALAIAENKLMRDEVTAHINANFHISPWHLTYGDGPSGTVALRQAIADFMKPAFKPTIRIEPEHIVICNGAGSAVSNLAFAIAEPGDGILVARPLYVGFFIDIEFGAKVKPIPVTFDTVNPFGVEAVEEYEKAYRESVERGVPIRAILLANPHNPLGRPYHRDFLIGILKLASRLNLHVISDEVYAKSSFPSSDFPEPPPFQSVLSLDLDRYIDVSLVHVIYALSKDFCANGIRIGAIISPANAGLVEALRAVSGFTRASQLAEHIWLNILRDPEFLDRYFSLLTNKLTATYEYTISFLKRNGIPYHPASVAGFIWIDLSAFLESDSQDAELALNWRLAKNGVWIAMGATFGSEKHGNYRLTFATPREELEVGLGRLEKVLMEIEQEKCQD